MASAPHRTSVARSTLAALAIVAGIPAEPPIVATGVVDPSDPQPPFLNADGSNDALTGVAQLDGLGPSCTGFLIDSGEPTSPAFVMTNGHCAGLFDATTIIDDAPAPDGSVARFQKFADTLDELVDVPTLTVHHATMRSTDVAVIELDATLGALEGAGIAAYDLGPAPDGGDEILVTGVPVDGIPFAEQVLRGGTCGAGTTTRLVEFEWLWDEAVATDCLGIVGGNSGSPVFAADDRSTVIAMVNTTTIGAAPGGSCYLGQPCEIGIGGAVEIENRTYLMPVEAWAACFDHGFEPTASGCPVERAPSVTVRAPRRAVQPGATWSATISAPEWPGDIAVKAGSVSSTDCRDAEQYARAGRAADVAVFDEPLPEDEGVYVACAATVDGTGAIDTGSAGYAVMQIDATPPTVDIELVVRADVGEEAHVEPLFAPPELSSFDVKFGPLAATDCASPDGYVTYRRIPIVVPAAAQPAVVCVIGEDEAGNRGEPQQFDISRVASVDVGLTEQVVTKVV